MSALPDMCGSSKKKVAYFYDAEVGEYSFGSNTVFKPHRVRMTHNLVLNYDLFQCMDVYQAPSATDEQMEAFHSRKYLEFLSTINPTNMQSLPPNEINLMVGFGLGDEQPIFPGMYKYTSAVAGASLSGASLLNAGKADIAINWSGGMHHAKKNSASGFCYVNDCVLAILELLKSHRRVLYIDIDLHHGDGVEEAFYCTNRVMTLSFHYFSDGFFPMTGGSLQATGEQEGKNCSLNFPYKEGLDDSSFRMIFRSVVSAAMGHFRPDAVVMQCGADSLVGDRLGRAAKSNISIEGHSECVSFVKGFNLPMLVLGGGGYTLSNVTRCWANETGVLVGKQLDDNIPEKFVYKRYFGSNAKLRLPVNKELKNANSPAYLQRTMSAIIETIKSLEGAPGTEFKETPQSFPLPSKRNFDSNDEEKVEGGDKSRSKFIAFKWN